jgi:hypothetical protein
VPKVPIVTNKVTIIQVTLHQALILILLYCLTIFFPYDFYGIHILTSVRISVRLLQQGMQHVMA